mmetsp:Transcript_13413/g.40557  ORF Transcript_13413/g.40557 Transcript_13413/m.40557 type:complete len:641 (-) Transcript_13413:766-2688(-)
MASGLPSVHLESEPCSGASTAKADQDGLGGPQLLVPLGSRRCRRGLLPGIPQASACISIHFLACNAHCVFRRAAALARVLGDILPCCAAPLVAAARCLVSGGGATASMRYRVEPIDAGDDVTPSASVSGGSCHWTTLPCRCGCDRVGDGADTASHDPAAAELLGSGGEEPPVPLPDSIAESSQSLPSDSEILGRFSSDISGSKSTEASKSIIDRGVGKACGDCSENDCSANDACGEPDCRDNLSGSSHSSLQCIIRNPLSPSSSDARAVPPLSRFTPVDAAASKQPMSKPKHTVDHPEIQPCSSKIQACISSEIQPYSSGESQLGSVSTGSCSTDASLDDTQPSTCPGADRRAASAPAALERQASPWPDWPSDGEDDMAAAKGREQNAWNGSLSWSPVLLTFRDWQLEQCFESWHSATCSQHDAVAAEVVVPLAALLTACGGGTAIAWGGRLMLLLSYVILRLLLAGAPLRPAGGRVRPATMMALGVAASGQVARLAMAAWGGNSRAWLLQGGLLEAVASLAGLLQLDTLAAGMLSMRVLWLKATPLLALHALLSTRCLPADCAIDSLSPAQCQVAATAVHWLAAAVAPTALLWITERRHRRAFLAHLCGHPGAQPFANAKRRAARRHAACCAPQVSAQR